MEISFAILSPDVSTRVDTASVTHISGKKKTNKKNQVFYPEDIDIINHNKLHSTLVFEQIKNKRRIHLILHRGTC